MKDSIRKTLQNAILALLVGGITFAWMRFWTIGRMDPVVFGDEFLLSYKAYVWHLFGNWLAPEGFPDVGTDYAPLYSVVASVVFGPGDILDAYPRILCLNAILLSLGVMFFFLEMACYGFSRTSTFWASLCIGLYSGYAGYSTFAMSEALFIPLLLVCLPMFLRSGPNSLAEILMLSIGLFLLLLTRKQGAGLLIGFPLALFLRNTNNRRKRAWGILLPIVFGVVSWKIVGNLKSIQGQQNISNYLQQLSEQWKMLLSLRPIIGQISYVNFATAGLLPLALHWVASETKKGNRGPLSVLAQSVCFAVPGVVHMYIHPGMLNVLDSRYQMYGRYIDAIVPAVLLFGIFALFYPPSSLSRLQKFRRLFIPSILVVLFANFTPQNIAACSCINIGVAWIPALKYFETVPFFRILLTAVLSVLVILAACRRERVFSMLCIAVFMGISFIGIRAQSRSFARNVQYFKPKIENLHNFRNKKNLIVFPETVFTASLEEYRARFYLADRYHEKKTKILPDNAWFLASDGTIKDSLRAPAYRFLEHFETAAKACSEVSQNPWGRTLARTTDSVMGEGFVMTSPATSICFTNVPIPDAGVPSLNFQVGFLSLAKCWNISDGIVLRVSGFMDGFTKVFYEQRILPTDSPQGIEIPLEEVRGRSISVSFQMKETPGYNGNGDWLFIGHPEILSMPKN